MATSFRIFEIFAGAATAASAGPTLIALDSQGTPGALRRIVHPDSEIVPVVYFSNPDRTFNLDNDVLLHPITRTFRTLDSTQLLRFETSLEDAIITEIWSAQAGAVMRVPTLFFRQLYNYLRNPPDFSATAQTYIQWQPLDKNAFTYNIKIIRLVVGGGGQQNVIFDISDTRPQGGWNDPTNPGDIAGPLDDLDAAFSGALDRTMQFTFLVVSKVE